METRPATKSCSPELRERAVRLVLEHRGGHASQWAAIGSIEEKIGCTAETLRRWVRRAERDQGSRDGATAEMRDRLKVLERQNQELRQASAHFCPGGARPPVQAIDAGRRSGSDRKPVPRAPAGIAFMDEHRDAYWVEPLCPAPASAGDPLRDRIDAAGIGGAADRPVDLP